MTWDKGKAAQNEYKYEGTSDCVAAGTNGKGRKRPPGFIYSTPTLQLK